MKPAEFDRLFNEYVTRSLTGEEALKLLGLPPDTPLSSEEDVRQEARRLWENLSTKG